jgi:hypothetical protein
VSVLNVETDDAELVKDDSVEGILVPVVFGIRYEVETAADVETTKDVLDGLVKSVKVKRTVVVGGIVSVTLCDVPANSQRKIPVSIFAFKA